jgi:hypothetical protein
VDIAVPVDFAIVGKLAQTVFPGSVDHPLKPKLSSSWIRVSVINDLFPSRCNLYCSFGLRPN